GTGTISYQWKRGGADIAGGTGASYTPVAADAGYGVSVTVGREGYSGAISSAALTVQNQAGITLVYPTVPDDPAGSALSSFTIYKTGSPNSHELSVQGDFDSYYWEVDGAHKPADAGSEGKTLTLAAADYSAGEHYVSLEVSLQGTPYSKTITFTVGN
ncbi:MAG: hypothetical protein LBT33_06255, partial [Spirochaetia bacterium]|nr:hypothetical protein [Spirochaetia bacterium]